IEAVNSGRRARSRPPWSLNAYSSLTIPGPDFAVKRSRLSNAGVETSRNPNDSASWMNRDSTKRRFAISSGPQSFVPRGRSNMGTRGVEDGSPLTFLGVGDWNSRLPGHETTLWPERPRYPTSFSLSLKVHRLVIAVLRYNRQDRRRSHALELTAPRRDSRRQLRARTGCVSLDLRERPSAGVRFRGRTHVPFNLFHSGPMALEGPEIQVAVPPDLLLDEAAADLHA